MYFDPFGLQVYRFPGNVYTDRPFSTAASTGCETPIWAGDFIVGWMPCGAANDDLDSCPSDSNLSTASSPNSSPSNDPESAFLPNENSSNALNSTEAQARRDYQRCANSARATATVGLGVGYAVSVGVGIYLNKVGGRNRFLAGGASAELAAFDTFGAMAYLRNAQNKCYRDYLQAIGQ
jgi:hypothetical protein